MRSFQSVPISTIVLICTVMDCVLGKTACEGICLGSVCMRDYWRKADRDWKSVQADFHGRGRRRSFTQKGRILDKERERGMVTYVVILLV